MALVTRILQPENLITGVATAVERATIEALGVKNHTPKLDQKRIDRAQRVVEILVADGILGTEPEVGKGFADDNDREQFEQSQGRS